MCSNEEYRLDMHKEIKLNANLPKCSENTVFAVNFHDLDCLINPYLRPSNQSQLVTRCDHHSPCLRKNLFNAPSLVHWMFTIAPAAGLVDVTATWLLRELPIITSGWSEMSGWVLWLHICMSPFPVWCNTSPDDTGRDLITAQLLLVRWG